MTNSELEISLQETACDILVKYSDTICDDSDSLNESVIETIGAIVKAIILAIVKLIQSAIDLIGKLLFGWGKRQNTIESDAKASENEPEEKSSEEKDGSVAEKPTKASKNKPSKTNASPKKENHGPGMAERLKQSARNISAENAGRSRYKKDAKSYHDERDNEYTSNDDYRFRERGLRVTTSTFKISLKNMPAICCTEKSASSYIAKLSEFQLEVMKAVKSGTGDPNPKFEQPNYYFGRISQDDFDAMHILNCLDILRNGFKQGILKKNDILTELFRRSSNKQLASKYNNIFGTAESNIKSAISNCISTIKSLPKDIKRETTAGDTVMDMPNERKPLS